VTNATLTIQYIDLTLKAMIFRSHDSKGHVRYCHHFGFVVICKLLTCQYFSQAIDPVGTNLKRMFLGWSSVFNMIFISFGKWMRLQGPIMLSDLLRFKKLSFTKPDVSWKFSSVRMFFIWHFFFLFCCWLEIKDGHHCKTKV